MLMRLATTAPKWIRRAGAVALGTTALAAMPVATASAGSDPHPECTDTVQSNCWDYRSWYWTYAGCQDEGRAFVGGQRQYDKYVCAGDHGLVVWLWLHKP
jgi:hypothetical protein